MRVLSHCGRIDVLAEPPGGAVKLAVGLFGLALLWGIRRSKRSIAELCTGAALTLAATYGMVGPNAFRSDSGNQPVHLDRPRENLSL